MWKHTYETKEIGHSIPEKKWSANSTIQRSGAYNAFTKQFHSKRVPTEKPITKNILENTFKEVTLPKLQYRQIQDY